MVLAAAVASAAAFFAAAGDVHPLAAHGAAGRFAGDHSLWQMELVAGPPRAFTPHVSAGSDAPPAELMASRMRIGRWASTS